MSIGYPRHAVATVLATAMLMASPPSAAGDGAVKVRAGTLTLPWYTAENVREADPANPRAMDRFHGTERRGPDRTFQTVVLENEFLRVTVIPEIGGAIASAVFKPTGDELFFGEGKAKQWLPYWESGVKASFPFREHAIGTVGQPAAWRIVHGGDGSATLATWMEFSRFTAPCDQWIYGRYSTMLLSQQFALRPGEATLAATFRLVNPTAYRQGRRLWTDTVFPRNHTPSGAVQADGAPPTRTDTEWVCPAGWVSGHGGANLRRYDESQTPLAPHRAVASIFPWDIPLGFTGLWYPSVKVNRLVLFNPAVSPGAKQWFCGEGDYSPGWTDTFKYNLVEVWNGSDSVFEGVENWIGPGEAWQFTQRYALVGGIGKVSYADANAAVSVRFGAGDRPGELGLVTFRPVARLAASLDGRQLGAAACGPAEPARFALPAGAKAGRVELRADDRLILRQDFPLKPSADTSRHGAIKAALTPSPEQLERSGDNAHYGETFRAAVAAYPAGSLGRGRLLYRDGYLPAAISNLRQAAKIATDRGEAMHLLAAALLEQGDANAAAEACRQSLSAQPPCPPAGYFAALAAVGRRDWADADKSLSALASAVPAHWEGRLLHAWVLANLPSRGGDAQRLADAMEAEDPADPRLALLGVRLAAGRGTTADTKTAQQRRAALDLLSREPGAKRRLAEFEAALNGRFMPPQRMDQ